MTTLILYLLNYLPRIRLVKAGIIAAFLLVGIMNGSIHFLLICSSNFLASQEASYLMKRFKLCM